MYNNGVCAIYNDENFGILISQIAGLWRSTQVVEETPLLREQVANNDARVRIPSSPPEIIGRIR